MDTVDIAQQPLLTGGAWTAPQDGATFERIDPCAGRAVTVEECTELRWMSVQQTPREDPI
jgi:hypothetical protein